MIKNIITLTLTGLTVCCGGFSGMADQTAQTAAVVVPTIAIMPFESRLTGASMEGVGGSVADLLSAQMSETGEFELADRGELNKIMGELKLSASGLVTKETQLKIGQLAGAKIIITGSIFKSGTKNYIVAKVIGVETSRVIGASVSGPAAPADLVPELKKKVAAIVSANVAKLLPPPEDGTSIINELKKEIKDAAGKKVFVKIQEHTILNVDPAAETEMKKMLQALGFTVVESPEQADFRITGEGLAENSGQFKEFFSATARIEVNLHAKDGRLIASDRQVETLAGPALNIACKEALARTSMVLAKRIFPQIK